MVLKFQMKNKKIFFLNNINKNQKKHLKNLIQIYSLKYKNKLNQNFLININQNQMNIYKIKIIVK